MESVFQEVIRVNPSALELIVCFILLTWLFKSLFSFYNKKSLIDNKHNYDLSIKMSEIEGLLSFAIKTFKSDKESVLDEQLYKQISFLRNNINLEIEKKDLLKKEDLSLEDLKKIKKSVQNFNDENKKNEKKFLKGNSWINDFLYTTRDIVIIILSVSLAISLITSRYTMTAFYDLLVMVSIILVVTMAIAFIQAYVTQEKLSKEIKICGSVILGLSILSFIISVFVSKEISLFIFLLIIVIFFLGFYLQDKNKKVVPHE